MMLSSSSVERFERLPDKERLKISDPRSVAGRFPTCRVAPSTTYGIGSTSRSPANVSLVKGPGCLHAHGYGSGVCS